MFLSPPMNQDSSTIEQHCVEAIELAKQSLTLQNIKEVETARDTCLEAKSGAKSMFDMVENEMDDLRKQKRHMEDIMSTFKKDQRMWKAYIDDLQDLARRCNNYFWDMKKEAQALNVKL